MLLVPLHIVQVRVPNLKSQKRRQLLAALFVWASVLRATLGLVASNVHGSCAIAHSVLKSVKLRHLTNWKVPHHAVVRRLVLNVLLVLVAFASYKGVAKNATSVSLKPIT